jgi:signal peptidase
MTVNVITYIGSSMFPTLKTGDILRVVQYSRRKIIAGDVIAFHSPNGRAIIVHRVIAIDQIFIQTKGDNNLRNDDWILSPNDILGQIVSVRRGEKNIIILSGFWGQKYVFAVRVLKRIIGVLNSIMLSPAYHWLSEKGTFKRLFSRRISTRLCCFKRGNGLEQQLIFGRRVIGRLPPGHNKWHIKRPFRLFVDERSLPNCDFLNQVFS